MNYKSLSIRTFIGTSDYKLSIQFYKDLGYSVHSIFDNMSRVVITEDHSFYLQDYYVKQWCDNSMIFLEVDDVEACYVDIENRRLPDRYKNFLHDPTGNLWHFGMFYEV